MFFFGGGCYETYNAFSYKEIQEGKDQCGDKYVKNLKKFKCNKIIKISIADNKEQDVYYRK